MAVVEKERQTRSTRIDPRLRRAGWTEIVPFAPGGAGAGLRATAVAEYPTADGPADYALCDGGRILGVVEANRLTVSPKGVLPQAERYSQGIDQEPRYQGEFGVPFLYSTNGEVIRFQDARDPLNLSRTVAEFHTPAALSEFLERDIDGELAKLATVPPNGRLRPYQIEANEAIEQAIRERRRTMLLTMATGTGKTLTMVNEVYRLMKSGVARRVLFLVDRRALAAQAVRAFASFEAQPGYKFDKLYPVYSQRLRPSDMDDDGAWDPNVMPASLMTDPKPGDAFVYVATIQRIVMNLFGGEYAFATGEDELDDEAEKIGDIPIHAFDLIVADECHRGYSGRERSIWQRTLDHFDGIKVGLTATPAAHTVAYFGTPVFRYEYERAVREGHLVDYDVVRLKSGVRMNGVFLNEQVAREPDSAARTLRVIDKEPEAVMRALAG